MSRSLRAFMLCLIVAGCGGGGSDYRNFSAPRNLDNACSIVEQRPEYLRAFKQTQRKWGVPVEVQMATIYQESKFVGNARTPFRYTLGVIPAGRQSSAFGYSQALDGTWEEYLEDTGNRRAKRDRIEDATDFMGWYMNLTQERNGIPLYDTRNQYLAYHEGHSGYRRGTYRQKAWLMRVAAELDDRAVLYGTQLRACGRL